MKNNALEKNGKYLYTSNDKTDLVGNNINENVELSVFKEEKTTIDIDMEQKRVAGVSDLNNGAISTELSSAGNPRYEDVYRSGNFGIQFGRIAPFMSLRWAYINLSLALLILLVTIIASAVELGSSPCKLDSLVTWSTFLGLLWMNSFMGVVSGILNIYFFRNLQYLRKPFACLMSVKLLAGWNVFVFTFYILFFWAFLFCAYPVGTKLLFAFLYILAIMGYCVQWSFLCKPQDPLCCCPDYRIFVDGEEIAPGQPDPPALAYLESCVSVGHALNNQLE